MIESISRQTKNTRRETFVNEFVGPTHDDEVKFYVSLKNIAWGQCRGEKREFFRFRDSWFRF